MVQQRPRLAMVQQQLPYLVMAPRRQRDSATPPHSPLDWVTAQDWQQGLPKAHRRPRNSPSRAQLMAPAQPRAPHRLK